MRTRRLRSVRPVRVTAIDHTVAVDACTDPEAVRARKIWTVAAVTSADPIYQWSSGGCTPTQPTSDTTYYRTKDSIGPERFVAGRVVELGGGRIKTRTIVGDDGSLAPAGAFDSDLDATCTVSSDRMQCIPAFVGSNIAEDTTCSLPIGVAPQSCAPPRYIGVAHDQLRLWRTGELYTDDPTRVITVYDSSILIAGPSPPAWTAGSGTS